MSLLCRIVESVPRFSQRPACASAVQIFDGAARDPMLAAVAQVICEGCPVLAECLDWSTREAFPHGTVIAGTVR